MQSFIDIVFFIIGVFIITLLVYFVNKEGNSTIERCLNMFQQIKEKYEQEYQIKKVQKRTNSSFKLFHLF